MLIGFYSVKIGKRQPHGTRFLLFLVLLLLLTKAAKAQVPAALVGRWALKQITFEARRPLPDSLQAKLFYSPAGETNAAVKEGSLTVEVEFRADGTYDYEMARQNQKEPFYAEHGRFEVKNGRLFSYGTTDDHSEPTLDKQTIVRLTRNVLQVEFPIWRPEQQVFQQIRYVRVSGR
ncbi:hypothetical protein SAMN06265337_1593 [Hymenobacter gelipurpurascens]|uniref:Lipocalin-like domain-containing protein n=1 Tax=Hymenobacter gelipurpurascens TaxID=89968 RepID=A0A212TK86_9BACT|nr:hypothetical protein SAMN06265337_1593 [Hymenobacter gelipurpurascens]